MEKQRPVYTPGMPFELMQNACMVRNDGRPCFLHEHKIEIREGVEADVHYCHGNQAFCDFAMGVALALSDERSELHKRVYSTSSSK